MTTKTKIKVSVAVILLSVVMAAMLIIGVCLSLNRSYTFKGKISIISSDIKATISKASVSGGELLDDNKMQQIEVDGLITETENLKTWEGLDFKLGKNSKDIVIRINIVNHSTDKTLKVSLADLSAKTTNTSVSVQFDGMDEGVKTTYIERAKTNQQGTVTQESFKQIVITLHANKKNKNTSLTDLNVPIELQSIDAYVVNLSNKSVEVDANTFVYTDVNTERVKLNQSLELCGNLVTLVNQSQYDFNYKVTFNNGTLNSYTVKAGKNIVFPFDKDTDVVIIAIVKVV